MTISLHDKTSWLWWCPISCLIFAILPMVNANDDDSDYHQRLPVLQAHAWFLWMAFGLLYPSGILVSTYGKQSLKSWFYIHWIVQLLATFCASAGLVIVLAELGSLGNTTHAKLGLALGALVWTQAILAAVRPMRKGRLKQLWYFSHWLFGTGSILVGWFNIFKGLDLYFKQYPHEGSQRGYYIAFSLQVTIFSFAYLLLGRWEHLLSQSRPSDIKDLVKILQLGKAEETEQAMNTSV